MIEFLTGTLIQSTPTYAVVQTGGIGWHLPITLSAYDGLPAEGQPVTLPTFLAVKEDSLTLYGFADVQERSLFELLLQVNGIGPKLAMTVLSGLPPSEFIRAVSSKDLKSLNRIPGIGKKMAERLMLELKDKVGSPGTDSPPAAADTGGKTTRDAVLALVALGYKQQEAKTLLGRIPAEEQQDCPVEDLVRRALQSS
jgi:Holliday junction DNA helicase RuvA